MKPAGSFLPLILVLSVALPGQTKQPSPETPETSAAEKPAKLSPSVSQQLTDQLPKYSPPAETTKKPAVPAGTLPSAADTDPELLHLKKVTVTPKKRPRLGDDVMMTSKAYNEQLARENLSSLDRNFLNRFTFPGWFGGVSAAERARDERNREQREQLANDVFGLARVVEINDPAQAKVLRDAVNRP